VPLFHFKTADVWLSNKAAASRRSLPQSRDFVTWRATDFTSVLECAWLASHEGSAIIRYRQKIHLAVKSNPFDYFFRLLSRLSTLF
jgi:hypothetical protein